MAESLLPFKEDITHDRRRLHIINRLGAGLTGEVYRAEYETQEGQTVFVAVKVMKDLAFPIARELFMQEGRFLRELMDLEADANRQEDVSFKIAPRYYGQGQYFGTPYIIEEFIDGTEIPKLLEVQGKLPESQALTAAWQLYRTLDILHTGLGRTYIDLKFEDLWWVVSADDPHQGQLKMTDLGTLEEIKEGEKGKRAIKRDVLLAGVYLFAMLTGYRLDYLIGELREDAEPHLRQNRANISWGTYQLLRKLLHRNAEARPDKATSVTEELSELAGFWQQSASELIDIAQANVEAAEQNPEDEQVRYYAERGLSTLDIAVRKGEEYDQYRYEDIKERAEKILSISDPMERAKGLFGAGSYTLARKLCQEGIHWSDEPAVLRRWAYLSMIGEEISLSKEQRQAVVEAVEIFNEGDSKAAKERLEALLPDMESQGINALLDDLQLFSLLYDASEAQKKPQENFRSAAQFYRQAMAVLEKLPDADVVRRETGDLLADAERMEHWAATRQQAEEKIKDANDILQKMLLRRESGVTLVPSDVQQSLHQALEQAAQAFELDRENPQRLTGLRKLAEAALSIGEFSFAVQFSEIGLNAPRLTPDDLAVLNIGRQLRAAETALQARDVETFQTTLRACWEQFSTNQHVQPAFLSLLASAAKTSRDAADERLAQVVAGLYTLLGKDTAAQRMGTEAEKIRSQRSDRLKDTVDNLLNEATMLLNLDKPERAVDMVESRPLNDILQRLLDRKGRLDEITRQLADAERVGANLNYRTDEISALKARLDVLIRHDAAQVQRITSERDRALNALRELERDIAQVKGEARLIILQDFVTRCFAYLNNVDSSNSDVEKWLNGAIQQLKGVRGWQQLQQEAARNLDLLTPKYDELESAFQSGQYDQAVAGFAALSDEGFGETQEWKQLKTRLVQVQSWRAWQEIHAGILESGRHNAGLLADLRGFAALGIPAPYWQTTALDYLEKIRHSNRETIRQNMSRVQDSHHLVGYLRIWLETVWTAWIVSGQAHTGAAPWTKDKFLREVYMAIRAGDFSRFETLVENAPIPPDIHSVLAGLTPETWQQTAHDVETEIATSEKQLPWRKIITIAGLALLGLYVVASAASIGFFLTRPTQAVSIVRSSTPTPSPTPIPLDTLTPTATLQPTATSLPTLTPTSRSSGFLLLPQVNPPVPVSAEGLWLLGADAAVVNPPFSDANVWLLNEQDNSHYTTVGNVNMTWEMDAALPAGYYQIFVVDTPTFSGGGQTFNVLIDGQAHEPFFGVNNVIFNTAQFGGQESADWLSIGVYRLSHGQMLSVQAAIGPHTPEQPFTASSLLIVKIPDDRMFMLLERGLPRERKLVSLLDDDRTAIYALDANGNPFDPYRWENPWGVVTDEQAWRKSFMTLNQPRNQTVVVDWSPAGRLPAGRYELYVWVPEQYATVLAEYSLLADGEVVEHAAPAQLNQIDWNAEWVSLGIWDMPAEAAVGIRMSILAENLGEIGVDAVALVHIEE